MCMRIARLFSKLVVVIGNYLKLCSCGTFEVCGLSPIYCSVENVLPLHAYSVGIAESAGECMNLCTTDDTCLSVGYMEAVGEIYLNNFDHSSKYIQNFTHLDLECNNIARY